MKANTLFLLISFLAHSQLWAQGPAAPVLVVTTEGYLVELSWNEIPGATGYTLFYADYPDAKTVASLDMMSRLSVAAELPAGSAFYIALQAYNNEGVSPFSNVESFALAADMPPGSEQQCAVDSNDSRYAWPLSGENGKDWVINNYVDLLSGVGTRDYVSVEGAVAKTYDGHNGIDIDIASFREMDAGVDIFALHDGRVSSVIDSNTDRSTFCASTPWNVVVVEQDDGNTVYYGHMKTDSAAVSIGQRITKGDLLGQVGSSGCSTQPHIHLELRKNNNVVVDPFRDNLWCSAPDYELPVSVLTGFLLEAPASLHTQPFKDPPADLEKIHVGTKLLPILHAANGSPGDRVGIRVIAPNGDVPFNFGINFTDPQRHSNWLWNPPAVDAPGIWIIEYQANGETQYTLQVEVE